MFYFTWNGQIMSVAKGDDPDRGGADSSFLFDFANGRDVQVFRGISMATRKFPRGHAEPLFHHQNLIAFNNQTANS